MNRHPYLRAYMAGVLLPSWLLLLALAVFLAGRHSALEKFFPFPMAVVPNLWGLWNVLYVRLRLQGRVSIGTFGALLPLVIAPLGIGLMQWIDPGLYTAFRDAAVLLPVTMALYYLAWKFGVGFFNRVVDLR